MSPQVVQTDPALQALIEDLSTEPQLAIDVEGDGLFRYRSRLCTVQLASVHRIAVVDTLAALEARALGELLGPKGPRKVVHDVSYDARLLHEYGVPLGNVFDTALAARFLGVQATGLAALLASRFGVTLPKEQQQSDWGRRPFTDHALAYLAADVGHLLALGESLEAEVRAAGIEAEVGVETQYRLWRALTDVPEERPPWTRIKGREELSEVGLAVLRELAEVRELAARRWDVPPFKVVGNAQLLEAARRRPKTTEELIQIRGMARGRARKLASSLLEAIGRGEAAGSVPPEERPSPEPAPPPEEREARKRRHRALTGWRSAEAKARGVDPQVVLPGHCLSDLALRGADEVEELRHIAGLGEVRVTRYGDALVSLLRRPS